MLAVRKDFPGLHQRVHGKPLVYLDNAATTQKPKVVIEALNRFYGVDCSNVHRAVHELSSRATNAYENARSLVKHFINARSEREIVFVRGATEAINLVMNSYARSRMKAGDEILISALEHHSNIVPWQLLCRADRQPSCGCADQRCGRIDRRRVRAPAWTEDRARGCGTCLKRAWNCGAGS